MHLYIISKMNIELDFEWDEAKRQKNIDAVKIFDNEEAIFTFQDTRQDWGENRFVTIGLLNGIEIAVVHTPRKDKRRIISVRRARTEERAKYYEEVLQNGD